MTRNLNTFDAVKDLVDHFYDRVRDDALIGPIFERIIEDRWPGHLTKMHRFWETVLLGRHTYRGFPFSPHTQLHVSQEHFDHWLMLFYRTLDREFKGENVEVAKRQASQMARMFLIKIEQLKALKTT